MLLKLQRCSTFSEWSEGVSAVNESHTGLTFTFAVAEKRKQSKSVTEIQKFMSFFLPLRSKGLRSNLGTE